MRKIVLIAISLLVAACATPRQYDGPQRPLSEVAVVHAPFSAPAVIEQIDGRWRGAGVVERYQLLPGPHTLGVIYVRGNASSAQRYCMEFQAEAGHTYALRSAADVSLRRWTAWLRDTQTGETVSRPCAGEAGS